MENETYEGPLVGGPMSGKQVASRSSLYYVAIMEPLSAVKPFRPIYDMPDCKVGQYRWNPKDRVFYWNGLR